MEIEHILTKIGLSDNEAKIYLALLPIGSAPASILGKRTNLPRSTAQFTSEQLFKQGLFKKTQKGQAFIYIAEPPEKLFYLVEQEIEEAEQKETDLQRIKGQLQQLYNPSAIIPQIKFYSTPEETLNILDEIIDQVEENGEIFSFAKILEKKDILPQTEKALSRFIEKRMKKKIYAKVLTQYNKIGKLLQKNDSNNLRETRLIDLPNLGFSGGEMFFIKDKIYTLSQEGQTFFAFMVESESITAMNKALFDFAWNQAKN